MQAFLSTILVWPPNFAPNGWALCAGQLMSISQNTALFSLLGATYGGDGIRTFGLPNLQGRVPVGAGQGSGLSLYNLGDNGGVESVNLGINTMPQHSHSATQNLSVSLPAVTTTGTTNQPAPSVAPAAPTDAARNPVNIYSNATPNQNLGKPSISGTISIGLTGNGLPHENRQPYLAVNYIIALQGFFPSRG
jgi:microcystin-dependent protein